MRRTRETPLPLSYRTAAGQTVEISLGWRHTMIDCRGCKSSWSISHPEIDTHAWAARHAEKCHERLPRKRGLLNLW